MFRLLALLFKLAIYLGAPLTIVAACVAGGLLAGLPDVALPPALGYVLGALLGTFLAAAVFGLPLIVLAIHTDVRMLQAQVQQLQVTAGLPPPLPGLMETVVAPVLAERALERILGD
jgi:hypothetical protein